MSTIKPVQAQNFTLSGGGAVIGDTSIILQSFQDIDGNNLTMTDFGSIGYGTLEPGSGSLEEQISFSGVTQNTNGTATLTGVMSVSFVTPFTSTSGLSKTHAGSTSFVISNTSGYYNNIPFKQNDERITGQWTFTNTPITPPSVSLATTTVAGISKLSVAAADPANPIVVGTNDTRMPSADPTTLFAAITSVPTGAMFPYAAAAAPTGFLLCDGTSYLRATYAALFAVIGTSYGSVDGTHFNVPDSRGRTMIGAGTGTRTATIASVAGNVFTVTGPTNAANNGWQTGQAVVFNATVAGNLTNGATYYLIRTGNLTFSVATSLANSQNGTVISLAGTETGSFTLTLTARSVGDYGGEENHAMSSTELLGHTHTLTGSTGSGGSGSSGYTTGSSALLNTMSTTGGNAAMNNMQPFFTGAWIIKT